MRHILLSLSLAYLCMAGCSYNVDVTNDPRFKGIAAKDVITKKELRLYGFSYKPNTGQALFDLTTVDQGETNLIGFVPAGHSVKLTRITQHHDIGIMWEQLQGEISFSGQVYPFAFDLGTSVYPDKWRRIFDSFEAKR